MIYTPLPVLWYRRSLFSDRSRLSELSHFSHSSKLSHICIAALFQNDRILFTLVSNNLKWYFISHLRKLNSKHNLLGQTALLNITFCEFVAGTSQNSVFCLAWLYDLPASIISSSAETKVNSFCHLLLTWNDKSCWRWLDGIIQTDTFLAKHHGDFQTILCIFFFYCVVLTRAVPIRCWYRISVRYQLKKEYRIILDVI